MAKKRNKIRLTGTVKGDRFKYDSPAGKFMFDEFISKHDGESLELEIKVIKDMKTLQQLRFYYGAILPAMVKATGDSDIGRLDMYLKGKYLMDFMELPDNLVDETTKVIPYIQSKADLTVNEMDDYIESVLQELCDCGGSLDSAEAIAYEATK
jgi:hypothetical protein